LFLATVPWCLPRPLQSCIRVHATGRHLATMERSTSTHVTLRRVETSVSVYARDTSVSLGGSVAEWLTWWTQVAAATLSGNSLRQTAHNHCASVHQAAKLVAALLRVAGVTAGLAESNGSLPPGLWLTSPAGWLSRTGISSGTLCSVIEYGLPFYICLVVSFSLDAIITVDCMQNAQTLLYRECSSFCEIQ